MVKQAEIKLVETPQQAGEYANEIIGMKIDGWTVEKVLIECRVSIKHEYYAAVINDHASKSPMLLFSIQGGMDIEEVAANDPDAMQYIPVSIVDGLQQSDVQNMLKKFDLGQIKPSLTEILLRLYDVYRSNDAELVEINPLVVTKDDQVVALDCKFTLDDSAIPRQADLAEKGTAERKIELEARAAEVGLKYIDLEGAVGVLANGAGLTMTTMDVIAHYGGNPANFMEIGGEAYSRGTQALSIVLDNPNIKSLLVNFCGAFARTDVMAEGVINACEELKPDIPIFFTIHGTGEEKAISLVKERLGIDCYDLMDDAVKAAVKAAQEGVA